MFTILNGGKENNSKVKFSKFWLILNLEVEDMATINVHEVYIKLSAAIEKAIAGTKQGVAGFKR